MDINSIPFSYVYNKKIMEINWKPVEPPVYQRGDLYETHSVECGYTELYRWINMNISTDWICDGTTKYYKQKEQV